MTKNNFVMGFYKLDDRTLDLLLLKVGELFTFKEIDMKNLVSSFLDIDVLVIDKKIPARVKMFLKNINIKVFNLNDYTNQNDLIIDINNYLIKKRNTNKDIKMALKLLNEIKIKGNLNFQELNHSIRVANDAKSFSKYIGYIDPNHLFVAGLLHDIGKTGIPNKILEKKGKLNKWEFDVIKAHPSIGSYLVPKSYQEIVKSHHERYDGSGYPLGIKKDKINLEAQILGIVDSYDTMITTRSYKSKDKKEKALNELLMCITKEADGGKGIKYNPKLTISYIKYKMKKEIA